MPIAARSNMYKVAGVLNESFPSTASHQHPLATAWMQRIVSSNEVLSSQLFAQGLGDKYLSGHASTNDNLLTRFYYTKTVEEIIKNMGTMEDMCSDRNILATIALAWHHVDSPVYPPEALQGPQQGPLKSLRSLHLYGGLAPPTSQHIQGLGTDVALTRRCNGDLCTRPSFYLLLVSLCKCCVPTDTKTVQESFTPAEASVSHGIL